MRGIFFIKKCVRSFIEVDSMLTMFPLIFVYVLCICMWLYSIIQFGSGTRVWSFYCFEILQGITEGPIVFGRMKDASVLYFDACMSR